MEISHDDALKAAQLLKKYCKERFHRVLGERGCKECIFSAGERRKRCIMLYYLEGVVASAETEVYKNHERLTQNEN